jgi:murein DD-endopeptidase MepM/ murein hydrolase activator NlpD
MEKHERLRRRGLGAAGALMPLVLVLAACAGRTGGPAPVVSGPPPPMQIVVERGQTLSGIAHAHHVPMLAVADANHLAPPYRILVGQQLVIPGAGAPGSYGPSLAMGEPMSAPTALPPAGPPTSAPPFSASPPPSAGPPPDYTAPVAPQPLAPERPNPQSEGGPPGAGGQPVALTPPSPSARLSPPGPLSPPPGAAAPPATAEASPPSGEHVPPHAANTAKETPGRTAEAEPPPLPRNGGGTFLWPVRGHVVEGYGTGPEGTHNDGINIAAPRGAAVEATDGGVVAYAGNELRGYGNLVLIKHANGWISAYAHCDVILVKTGQKVVRGQVIARVGSSGNVSEPQLHFELRRGKKPVDPRGYLTPLPAVATKDARSG